jgi:hypothetical protein
LLRGEQEEAVGVAQLEFPRTDERRRAVVLQREPFQYGCVQSGFDLRHDAAGERALGAPRQPDV